MTPSSPDVANDFFNSLRGVAVRGQRRDHGPLPVGAAGPSYRLAQGAVARWHGMGAEGANWLRTAVELARESSRDSGNQLVFVEAEDTFLLRRTPYDWTFQRQQYRPHPGLWGRDRATRPRVR